MEEKKPLKKDWDMVLAPDEELKKEYSISIKYRITFIILFLLLSIFLIVNANKEVKMFYYTTCISAILVFVLALLYFGFYLGVAYSYALTNKRILVSVGWLSKKLTSVDYDKITDITIEEPFFERFITKTGNLLINTAGTPLPEIRIIHVSFPKEIKREIEMLKSGLSS
jgi:uncharacterized membrane protein YdbT with pleckstrin-like domain